jgi:hypothetical protein
MSSDDEEQQHFDPHEEADENIEEQHEQDDGYLKSEVHRSRVFIECHIFILVAKRNNQ